MKKSNILYLAFIGFLFACSSPKSEKGKWLEKDKEDFKKECMATYDKAKPEEVKMMQQIGIADKADYTQICDCSLQNAEAMFLPEEIKANQKEQENIAAKCLVGVIGEKGAWKATYKDFVKESLLKQTNKVTKEDMSEEEKELIKGLVECSVDKLEKEIAPVETFKNPKALETALNKTLEECGNELHLSVELLKAIMEQNINANE